MGGKLPLTNRHFDGIQKTVKMTNTAVGLSRPVEAYLLSLGVVLILRKM